MALATPQLSDTFRSHIVGLGITVPTVHGEKPYINFDNAASTPPSTAALDAVTQLAPWYASVHRGMGFKSQLSTKAYDEAHEIVAGFVGATAFEHVTIFTKNTTEAINKLSYRLGLGKRDIVLISQLEHHSNDLPWRRAATVVRIGLTPAGSIDHADFERLLSAYGERVKLVALSGASNVTGYAPNIHWFARTAHEAGAQIFVDCAQLAPHRPITMKRLDDPEHLDYIAFSAHKLYAPFGTGVLVGRWDTFVRSAPEYRGGGTVRVVTPTQVDWAALPDREEAGSPNVIGAVACARSIQLLERLGMQAVAKHEAELTRHALTELSLVPGITLYGDMAPASTRLGVITFNLTGLPHQLVAAILSYEWGIGVRHGCFCAQPYVMHLLRIPKAKLRAIQQELIHDHKAHAPGMVRISFGLYNTISEIDMLVTALNAIVRGEYGRYKQSRKTGEFIPVGWTIPNKEHYFSLKS